MQEGKRQKQIGGLLFEELSNIFQRLGLNIIDGGMISISSVKITPDLLEVRVYLSLFQVKDPQAMLQKVEDRKWEIKKEFLGVIVFCCILWFGGQMVLRNEIPLEASAFIGYLALFYNIINPVKALSASFSNLQKGTAAIARIEEVLVTPNTVDENPQGLTIPSFDTNIEFRNVGFAYDDAVILDNINLRIEKGKTIALVGSSGAGKSTLADLVPRFHDVTSGELLIDGVNIKKYSLHSLRGLMSIVTQEPILFNDTIANNMKFGKPGATEEEIVQASKVANAHDFILRKEHGYETNIGDRGSKLSGGEKQRLTIARAVLKNPPILILDEATSSLDTESERLVQDAINNMMQNRTSIVIAHRLSTVRHADEIIVLKKGRIVERGTHEQLIQHNGFYKRLVHMQGTHNPPSPPKGEN